MEKVPLTASGVQTKQAELFALDQTRLDLEANALVTDFRSWITKHFELGVNEQNYLASANEDFIRLLSSIVFVGVRNRLPIDFIKSPVIKAVKRFDVKSAVNCNYLWGGGFDKSSDIKLNIIYQD